MSEMAVQLVILRSHRDSGNLLGPALGADNEENRATELSGNAGLRFPPLGNRGHSLVRHLSPGSVPGCRPPNHALRRQTLPPTRFKSSHEGRLCSHVDACNHAVARWIHNRRRTVEVPYCENDGHFCAQQSRHQSKNCACYEHVCRHVLEHVDLKRCCAGSVLQHHPAHLAQSTGRQQHVESADLGYRTGLEYRRHGFSDCFAPEHCCAAEYEAQSQLGRVVLRRSASVHHQHRPDMVAVACFVQTRQGNYDRAYSSNEGQAQWDSVLHHLRHAGHHRAVVHFTPTGGCVRGYGCHRHHTDGVVLRHRDPYQRRFQQFPVDDHHPRRWWTEPGARRLIVGPVAYYRARHYGRRVWSVHLWCASCLCGADSRCCDIHLAHRCCADHSASCPASWRRYERAASESAGYGLGVDVFCCNGPAHEWVSKHEYVL